MCTKHKHKDQFKAFKHIGKLRAAGKGTGKMGVYYCASCNAYHITSKTSNWCQFVI